MAPAQAPEGVDAAATLLPRLWGRLCQLAIGPGGGQRSLAVALLAQAQRAQQTIAWVQPQQGQLYPPDIAAAGVDVDALIVLHVGPPAQSAERLRAVEWLLTGGGFGLVVVDLNEAGRLGDAWQARLLRLVREHHSAVVVLGGHDAAAPSLGPLVALRLQAQPMGAHGFDLRVQVQKSKMGPLAEPMVLHRRGPEGLV